MTAHLLPVLTNIGASLLAAHEHINQVIMIEKNMFRPEIWFLTDDDTSVSTIKPDQLSGTKVLGMAVESNTDILKDFCKATGGSFWERV